MDLKTLVDFLNLHVDELDRRSFYCDFDNSLDPYKNTARLIQACGHDTTELQNAIFAAEVAISALKKAREKAVCRFKQDGVCFTVDETKRKEIEATNLQ